MTPAFSVATVLMVGYCLWVRRDTWWSRWEVGTTFAIAIQSLGILLLTPWAAFELGPALHSLLGMWNAQQLLGWLCVLAGVLGNIYHMLVRLTDPAHVWPMMRKHLAIPVGSAVVAVVAGYYNTQRGFEPDVFARLSGDRWLTVAEVAITALALYLTAYSSRLLFALWHDRRGRTTLTLYVTAIAFALTANAAGAISAYTGHDASTAIWPCTYMGTLILAYGAARSWQAKAAWFSPPP